MNKTSINIGEFTFSFDEAGKILADSNGIPCAADVQMISPGEYSVIVKGESYHLFLNRTGNQTSATVNNFIFPIEKETLRDRLSKRLQAETGTVSQSVTLRAPMPGMITKVLKAEGSTVNTGDGILIVEAMKMENEIKALRSGTLKKIFVKEKQTVEKNDNLFTIE